MEATTHSTQSLITSIDRKSYDSSSVVLPIPPNKEHELDQLDVLCVSV